MQLASLPILKAGPADTDETTKTEKHFHHEWSALYGIHMYSVCIVLKALPPMLHEKQVDILIFKNQALQILHLKHCVYKTT